MITNHDLRHEATELGKALQSATNWTPETRTRAIVLRTRLFQRGFYDPILGRLDSATVPQATVSEIAQQLAKIAEALN
jgi:hypothetical protein